jgi:HPt (histidine-containing phosphotransfer) domain-containing protein
MANAMKGDRERCLGAGMDGYVAKPFSAQELFKSVEGTVSASGPFTPTRDVQLRPPTALDIGNLAEILDWETARKRLCGQAESLAQLFFQEAPQLMAEIQAAIAAGEAARLERAAHTLKGAADIFAGVRVVELAGALESMGRDGRMANAKATAESLDDQVKRLISALQQLSNPSRST